MQTYKLKLTALSPIHIGTGEDYEPTNFVIDNGKLYNFDEILFYKSLNETDKKAFNQKLDNWLQIIDFYKSKVNNAVQISNFSCSVTKKVETRYKELKNADGTKNKNQFQIAQTFKNPNIFRAIIPGSSIKGMFDTVLKIYPPMLSNEARQKLNISDALIVDGGTEIGYSYRRHKIPEKAKDPKIPQMVEIIKQNSTFICQIKTEHSFEALQNMMKIYHQDRKDSRFEQTTTTFTTRIGKYCGKEYMVDDGKNVKNSYNKPIATHTVYEVDNQPFGWIKFELIGDDEYSKMAKRIQDQENQYYIDLKTKQQDIVNAIQKAKDEALRLIQVKEARRVKEAQEQEEKAKLEVERLATLSPLDLKIDELQKQNPSTPQTTLLLQNIENGVLEEFKKEALEKVKQLMINAKEWKEQPTGKKPEKDKDYQKTLRVKKLLG